MTKTTTYQQIVTLSLGCEFQSTLGQRRRRGFVSAALQLVAHYTILVDASSPSALFNWQQLAKAAVELWSFIKTMGSFYAAALDFAVARQESWCQLAIIVWHDPAPLRLPCEVRIEHRNGSLFSLKRIAER